MPHIGGFDSFALKNASMLFAVNASNVFVTTLARMTNEVFGEERCHTSLVSLNQVSIWERKISHALLSANSINMRNEN